MALTVTIPGNVDADLLRRQLMNAVDALDSGITYVVDGNGWGTPTVLWTFNSCPNNNNCGAVSGNSQLFVKDSFIRGNRVGTGGGILVKPGAGVTATAVILAGAPISFSASFRRCSSAIRLCLI